MYVSHILEVPGEHIFPPENHQLAAYLCHHREEMLDLF